MKRVTIKDLASLLHLSPSTVSRALSDHPDISAATKERVRTVADELNYTTNLHAKQFRNQNSGLIALILPEVNMFYTPKVIKGITKEIFSSRYSLITFLTNDSFKREKEVIKQCMSWAVEGVMISLSKETHSLDHLQGLVNAKISCVLLDKTIDNNTFTSVSLDGHEASQSATAHLIENGHTNILGIFGDPQLKMTQERIGGYENAIYEAGIPFKKENIISVNQSQDLDLVLPTILNHNKDITAIFTMSDELLIKTVYHLHALNRKIPEDISIISISDGVYPYLSHPQITHIKDSGTKMGKSASKLLINSISENYSSSTHEYKLNSKLVQLHSVTKILQHSSPPEIST